MRDLSITAKSQGRAVPKLRQSLQQSSQLSVKYWRWIRSQVRKTTSWIQALDGLRLVYAAF